MTQEKQTGGGGAASFRNAHDLLVDPSGRLDAPRLPRAAHLIFLVTALGLCWILFVVGSAPAILAALLSVPVAGFAIALGFVWRLGFGPALRVTEAGLEVQYQSEVLRVGWQDVVDVRLVWICVRVEIRRDAGTLVVFRPRRPAWIPPILRHDGA